VILHGAYDINGEWWNGYDLYELDHIRAECPDCGTMFDHLDYEKMLCCPECAACFKPIKEEV